MRKTVHANDSKEDALPLNDRGLNNGMKKKSSSVSMKLNVINIIVILSGVFSIYGAYEIQVWGNMHKLNYLHQKYITQLIKSVKTFETKIEINALDLIQEDIIYVKQQPTECLERIGPTESFMMGLINTDNIIQICIDDLQIANELINKIQAYRMDTLDKPTLIAHLYLGIEGFEKSGVNFGPLVVKTVDATFLIVITIIIAKAFIVPMFGFLLSRSVARDYQTLIKTKINLEKEKKHSALIQSERMNSLTTLVVGVAHEINTPVGVSITANSHSHEMLKKIKQAYEAGELTESDFRQFFIEIEQVNNIINDNLDRTSSLIDGFKMISLDQTFEELQVIKFKTCIEQVLVRLSPLTKDSNIVIKLDCDERLQGYFYDEALIHIITNMVTNAITHAFKSKEHGTLLISVIQTNEDGILMSFEDDGCGISEVDLIHIFEPFFTTKRGRGGTGLGLHLIHRLIVDKLNGRMSCSSEIGHGSRFEIYLPIDFNMHL